MRTYTFKSIARRGTSLAAVVALVATTVLPSGVAFADALNPLTERSLTLSSGSPGWSYLDASGNATYAPPNSGANGRKTGNTFGFRVSSDATVRGFSFQYCTTSAGNCLGPGDIPFAGTAGSYTRDANNQTQIDAQKSDLEVVTATPSEVSGTTFTANFDAAAGQPSSAANVPSADNSEGNFIVLTKANVGDNWAPSSGWTMAADVNQTNGGSAGTVLDGTSTGKNNYITLTNATGVDLDPGSYVKIIFFGTDTNYMINPGSSWFFAKLNTWDSATTTDFVPGNSHNIDGGVTVANVMNRSIEIQTKVLETMDFSVGTVDPNTLDSTGGAGSQFGLATGRTKHGVCDPVVTGMTTNSTTPNVLQMGNPDGEFSLETLHTYSTHSFWRLSSNSSAGASVYYSGVTLSNTVNDQIEAIGTTAESPTPGTEQFGLALDNGDDTTAGSDYFVSYDKERQAGHIYQNGADNAVGGLHTASLAADDASTNGSWHDPRLAPLLPATGYGNGTGIVNTDFDGDPDDDNVTDTEFAFDPDSTLVPALLASESDQVVDCVTGKVRYIANIAATTPAGIYTTKINYIAAPQY